MKTFTAIVEMRYTDERWAAVRERWMPDVPEPLQADAALTQFVSDLRYIIELPGIASGVDVIVRPVPDVTLEMSPQELAGE